jgi:hypothetical protein
MASEETSSATALQAPSGCSLFGDELSDRMQVVATLFAGCDESREQPDGFAFRFPGTTEWTVRLAEFISDERTCCAFFTFELVFDSNGGPTWLLIRGSALVKQFVRTRLEDSSQLPTPVLSEIPRAEGGEK